MKVNRKEVHQLLEEVNSKESFMIFLKALQLDKEEDDEKEKDSPSSQYSSSTNGWENRTIADFLESMHAFGEDSETVSDESSWYNFAVMLYGGKIYE